MLSGGPQLSAKSFRFQLGTVYLRPREQPRLLPCFSCFHALERRERDTCMRLTA